MADYDQIGAKQEWVPYLMTFCQPLCRFPSVTTDNTGLRTTVDRSGAPLEFKNSVGQYKAIQGHSIVAGGSTVFGVGATHDAKTIPSNLNRMTNCLWLNFGGRAFNSTQEAILFLLHLPCSLDRLLIFSGVNNIVLALLNNRSSPIYGAIYDQSLFEASMNGASAKSGGVRQAASQLLREIHQRLFDGDADQAPSSASQNDNYSSIIACFHRDLRALKTLALGLGGRPYFALQPMAVWIDKLLSPEERKLFEILDKNQAGDWHSISNYLATVRDRYFSDVARICEEEKIPFYNLNLDPAFMMREWLFVDRVHLTDCGHELAAKIVTREFDL